LVAGCFVDKRNQSDLGARRLHNAALDRDLALAIRIKRSGLEGGDVATTYV
jgi:hypothetical protein